MPMGEGGAAGGGSGRLQFARSQWDPPGHALRDMLRPNRKGAAKTLHMRLSVTGPASLVDLSAGRSSLRASRLYCAFQRRGRGASRGLVLEEYCFTVAYSLRRAI